MKSEGRPVRTTIVFGLLSAIAFLPLVWASAVYLAPAWTPRVALSAMLAVYGLIMARWSGTGISGVCFPSLVLLVLAFCRVPASVFFLLALGVLSWVRSGVCFPGRPIRALAAEVALGAGSAALLVFVGPGSPVAWALAVWMFFLLQSLYFIFCGISGDEPEEGVPPDAFEQARLRAERILTDA